jgi:hypothetical protein
MDFMGELNEYIHTKPGMWKWKVKDSKIFIWEIDSFQACNFGQLSIPFMQLSLLINKI